MRTIPALTGVRGCAALWVLAYHVGMVAKFVGLPFLSDLPIARDGWIGTDLFFMLSGFVLMYAHETAFRRLTIKETARFLQSRILRIYPVSTAVLLIVLAIVLLDPGFRAFYRSTHSASDLSPRAFIATLLLATRWGFSSAGDWNQPVWSVSVEMLGYAAFPIIAVAVARLDKPQAAFMVAAASLGALIQLSLVIHRTAVNDIGDWAICRMAGCFIGGVALCRAWRLLGEDRRRGLGRLADVGAVVLVAACLIPHGLVLAVPAFAAMILGLACPSGVLAAILSRRPAMWLGRVSFPLYLLHVMPLMWLMYFAQSHRYGAPLWALILGAYVLTCLGAAYGVHVLVEQPFHRLARRWTHRTSATPATPRLAPHSLLEISAS